MAHLALYRRWRPRTFDEVVGQDYVVTALKHAVASTEIAHALLFTGTRGTGKTSLAKIVARAINCQNPQDGNPCNECDVCKGALDGSLMDILEMDAASNNSVENIRQIIEQVNFAPTLAPFKVYIIDEAHMITPQAFNALLKTLEEPPAHVVFILATTDPQRIPATILSRCQRYDFKRIGHRDMARQLRHIADTESINIDNDAIMTICALADGALRDAISLLDQARSAHDEMITRKTIQDLVGMVDDHFMGQTIAALIRGDAGSLLGLVQQMMLSGQDLVLFTTGLAQYYRNLLVVKTTRNPSELVHVPERTMAGFKQLAKQYSPKQIVEIIQFLSNLIRDVKQSANPRLLLEISLIQLLNKARISDEVEPVDTAASTDANASAQSEPKQAPPAAPDAKLDTPTKPDSTPAPEPIVEPAPEVPAEPETAPETEPTIEAEPELEPQNTPEPEADEESTPAPAPETDQDHTSEEDEKNESEPEEDAATDADADDEPNLEPSTAETKPSTAPMPPLTEYLKRLQDALFKDFSQAEAAMLLPHGKASWEDENLRMDFAPNQASLYNRLAQTHVRQTVVKAMRAIDPDHHGELLLHLQSETTSVPDDAHDATPEWVKHVIAAAEPLGIPVVRDDLKEPRPNPDDETTPKE